MLDVSGKMALADPLEKLLQLRGIARGQHLDASVGEILHPAGDLVSLGE